ncbi:prepilin peptidase [Crateriforma conspicua]|uniref:Type IV leader peptidase family protein n=1 Tax=Crateriforma conspicua TaxID=2527996 RepID=A0A5C6FWU9_9PLAN|nr:A24 family peptidase [Crateriforma conspicua]TWU67632.1 Type IV leader peptidase family protein [Crateriforma conspicua]
MLQPFIELPLIVRWIILALLGLGGGVLANHVIYTWCWFPRPISPWRRRNRASDSNEAKPTAFAATDRIPLFGWLIRSRRDAAAFGRWFWVRPLMIELGLMIALPAYYQYTCVAGGMLPEAFRDSATVNNLAGYLNWIFLAHALLLILMTAATFIDFDEQTIPDLITIPGTLIALTMATASPWIFMPALVPGAGGVPASFRPITFSLPDLPADPKWFTSTGWWTAIAIWSGWCFALSHRRVILRKGWAKAVEFFLAGLVRYPTWKFLMAMWLVGLVAVSGVYLVREEIWGGIAWTGLLTSLFGLAVGGSVVWAIRIVASAAMGVEAMGFGDVTLMAMIGAFVGWQASIAAFFLSPIAAIAIVLVQYAITRESRVPFGPYLCAGTVLTMLYWNRIYAGYLESVLITLGPSLLWFALSMCGLLGVMLFVWGLIKKAAFQ